MSRTLVPVAICVPIAAGERAAFYIVITGGTGSFESFDDALGAPVVQTPRSSCAPVGSARESAPSPARSWTAKAWQGIIHYTQ